MTGEIWAYKYTSTEDWIILVEELRGNKVKGKYIRPNVYINSNYICDKVDLLRRATPEEEEHFRDCELAGKFVPASKIVNSYNIY